MEADVINDTKAGVGASVLLEVDMGEGSSHHVHYSSLKGRFFLLHLLLSLLREGANERVAHSVVMQVWESVK